MTTDPTPPVATIPEAAVEAIQQRIARTLGWPPTMDEARLFLEAALPHIAQPTTGPAHESADNDNITVHQSVWELICEILDRTTVGELSGLAFVGRAIEDRPADRAQPAPGPEPVSYLCEPDCVECAAERAITTPPPPAASELDDFAAWADREERAGIHGAITAGRQDMSDGDGLPMIDHITMAEAVAQFRAIRGETCDDHHPS